MKRLALIAFTAAMASGGLIVGTQIGSHAIGKEPRFPQLTLEQLNDQQRPLSEKIMRISSVGLGGPYNPMLRSPVLANACTTCSTTCAGTPRFPPSSMNSPS